MGEYASMILNRPVYLIQLKFLLSSNTVHDRAMMNANCDSRMRQGHTAHIRNRTNAPRPISAVDLRFAIIDTRAHAHARARVWDYAFPLQGCDPGEIHFDP